MTNLNLNQLQENHKRRGRLFLSTPTFRYLPSVTNSTDAGPLNTSIITIVFIKMVETNVSVTNFGTWKFKGPWSWPYLFCKTIALSSKLNCVASHTHTDQGIKCTTYNFSFITWLNYWFNTWYLCTQHFLCHSSSTCTVYTCYKAQTQDLTNVYS